MFPRVPFARVWKWKWSCSAPPFSFTAEMKYPFTEARCGSKQVSEPIKNIRLPLRVWIERFDDHLSVYRNSVWIEQRGYEPVPENDSDAQDVL